MNSMKLFRWLLIGEWHKHIGQALVTLLAIAIGVAMGFSIHLLNSAAFNEFSAASKSLSGQSDLLVRAKTTLMDEAIYPQLAAFEGVAVANPVLELDVAIPGKQHNRNDYKLKVIGIDMFRAAQIAPDLLGLPEEGKTMDRLADDTIFLSPAAMTWLAVKEGDRLPLQAGLQQLTLRVAGGLVRARSGQRIAVMDIGAAQWRLQHLGKLSRVELKLKDGLNHEVFKSKLSKFLGDSYTIVELENQETRVANMSRAYRVNLNMLALVALFTGSFLVFSTQALSVSRRRSQFALLRVLGFTRHQLLWQVVIEGIVLGVLGSLLGVLLGYVIATTVIEFFGGNLGSSFFPGIKPEIYYDSVAAWVFFAVGLTVTLLGSLVPALEAARAKPALALKSGNQNAIMKKLAIPWFAVACLFLAGILTQLPALNGLPVFGYLAIALLLIGGIALMPYWTTWFFAFISNVTQRPGINVVEFLSLARLTNAPNQASIALGGILASFSLMVAMAIMVTSFRVSVDQWLERVLPADLYVRTAAVGDQGGFDLTTQQAIAALPVFSQADFFRAQQVLFDSNRPEVMLFARPIDRSDPRNTLPINSDGHEVISLDSLAENTMPIWVSEAMVDLYDYQVGKHVVLPIGDESHDFKVVGVWRDYGRQFGAVQMQLDDYQRITGDTSVNTVALWLQSAVSQEQAIEALRQLPFGTELEISRSSDLRTISLEIFDRSFAVTYLLELVAVIIGLSGVAASFSAQMLARMKEFGMLRHIGMKKREILMMLAAEGGLLTGLGILFGFLLGWGISLILIFIVNPQSFHWTMQIHFPWSWLLIMATVMIATAAGTALLAGRRAISGHVIQTVREDW